MSKILVVDDSAIARQQVVQALQELAPEVVEAENGVDGLAKFDAGGFDLIITDVNMPEMDGLEMSRKIRENDDEIPIILVTTESTSDMIDQGDDIGVTGWMVKPFNPVHLVTAVRKVIGT